MRYRQRREQRAAHNEDLFRRINERLNALAGVARGSGSGAATATTVGLEHFVCECSQRSCSRVVELTPEEYEAVRAHPRRFLVFPASVHTTPEIEDVVERQERYWVVEKHGRAGAEAEALDRDGSGL